MASKDPQSENIRPGMVFCDRYRIQKVLAHGGMATIYLAVDESTDHQVAVKVLYQRYSDNTVVRARFLDEGRLQAMLDHPNIVSVYDVISEPVLSFVMEYVEGETLEEYLQRKGPLDEDKVLEMLMPVMSAVGFAHGEGIIHRDLKPSNILLAEEQNFLEPKIMDFGVAKVSRTNELTQDGTTVGTLHYMSPEQIVGSRDIDGRADIYSLGCSLYKLCTGEVPFNASSEFALMMAQVEAPPTPPSELRPELSGDLEKLILKALSKQPDKRFQTIKEMTSELMKLGGDTDPDDTITRPVPGDLLEFALGADEVARDQTDKIRLVPTTNADDGVDVDEQDVQKTTSTMELSSTAVQKIEKDRLRAARRKSGDTQSMPRVGGGDETIDEKIHREALEEAPDKTIDESIDLAELTPDQKSDEDDQLEEFATTTEHQRPDLRDDEATRRRSTDDSDGDQRGVVAVENPDVDSREVTDLHHKNRLDDDQTDQQVPPDTLRDSPSSPTVDHESNDPGSDEMSTEREMPAALRESNTDDSSAESVTARQRPSNLSGSPSSSTNTADETPRPTSSTGTESPGESARKGYSQFRSTPAPTVDHDTDESNPPALLWIGIGLAALIVVGLAVWLVAG